MVAMRFTLGQSKQGERFLFVIVVQELGKHLIWLCTESACNWIYVFIKNRAISSTNGEGKSLRHVAMVAKLLDDSKPIKPLKSVFALFQTSPILFNFIQFGKSWRNFLWDRVCRYVNLEKESDNFRVVFIYSIKRAREIRKFHVVVLQRRQKKMYKMA